MDRIWQWAWDRHASRYSWAIWVVTFFVLLPHYLLLSFIVVAFEGSGGYVEAAGVTVVAMLVLAWVAVLPGRGPRRLVDKWADDHDVDRARTLDATYAYARGLLGRAVTSSAVCGGARAVAVGAMAGAGGSRLVQYAILGAVFGG